MVDLYGRVRTGGTFGTKSSKTTSGKLSLAFLKRIEFAQHLSIVKVLNLGFRGLTDRPEDIEDDLHIQSFTDGDRTLYHCRMKARSTAPALDCHPAAYSTWPASKTMQWKHQPRDKFEMNPAELKLENDLEAYLRRLTTHDR